MRAYTRQHGAMRKKMREEFPELSMQQLTEKISERWSQMTEEERVPFIRMADPDKPTTCGQTDPQPTPTPEGPLDCMNHLAGLAEVASALHSQQESSDQRNSQSQSMEAMGSQAGAQNRNLKEFEGAGNGKQLPTNPYGNLTQPPNPLGVAEPCLSG